MWESRRDFQGVWEGWKNRSSGPSMLSTLRQFPWLVFDPPRIMPLASRNRDHSPRRWPALKRGITNKWRGPTGPRRSTILGQEWEEVRRWRKEGMPAALPPLLAKRRIRCVREHAAHLLLKDGPMQPVANGALGCVLLVVGLWCGSDLLARIALIPIAMYYDAWIKRVRLQVKNFPPNEHRGEDSGCGRGTAEERLERWYRHGLGQ